MNSHNDTVFQYRFFQRAVLASFDKTAQISEKRIKRLAGVLRAFVEDIPFVCYIRFADTVLAEFSDDDIDVITVLITEIERLKQTVRVVSDNR